MKTTLIAVLALGLLSATTNAEVVDLASPPIVDTSFEGGATVYSANVPTADATRGWFEALGTSSWGDMIGPEGVTLPTTPYGTMWAGFGEGKYGRLYTQIGTVGNAGTATLRVAGLAAARSGYGWTDSGDVEIELWVAPTNFTGADGADLYGNANYLNGVSLTGADIFGAGFTAPTAAEFTTDIDVTLGPLQVGDNIWLSFAAVNGPGTAAGVAPDEGQRFFDNPGVAFPPPTGMVLWIR